MKVCTDACLFGAWIANKIEGDEISADKILDIGTGTGLLSLMLAQKTTATIDAVEIVKEAFLQAKENIKKSPWGNRINIINSNILNLPAGEKYDLIICNPPFYEGDLKSPHAERNIAMHSTDLTFFNLVFAIKNNLSDQGIAAVLLPFSRINAFKNELTAQKLFTTDELHISNSPQSDIFRSILIISFSEIAYRVKKISVKNETGEYSVAFKDLLKDYYLKL